MLQRIGLAQAMVNHPDLIFLDEPTGGLDPNAQMEIRALMRKLRDQGTTIFLCSHLLRDMEPLCDSVAIVARGKVRKAGLVAELLIGEGGRYRLQALGVPAALVQELQDQSLEVKREGEGVSFVFADQLKALSAATAIAHGGGTILELGARTRSLEDVFIEAVAGGEG